VKFEKKGFGVELIDIVNSGVYKLFFQFVNYSVEVKAGEIFLKQCVSTVLNSIP
jgi:hypothetical protein